MENIAIISIFTIVLLLVLLLSGIWIGIAVGVMGILLYILFVGGRLDIIGIIQFNVLNSFTWTAVPLFIFMGGMISHSGVGDRMYKGASTFVGFFPGGLLHTNIAACALFAATSGSSVATAATLGSIAIPELKKRGYDKRLILGSLAAGGTLGILIPPSLAFIIYGAVVGESIGKLFMAGIIPGIMLAGFFMIQIMIVSIFQPDRIPEREKINLKKMASGIIDLLPIGILILIVLGSIYVGIATPTEAAALGASGSLLIASIYKKLSYQILKAVMLDTVKITSMLVLLVVGTQIMSMALSDLKIPQTLSTLASSFGVSKGIIFVLVVILYLILGCFIEAAAMTLLTLPVTYPLMMSFGFDSVWFGVIVVILSEAALITPPVGLNLFVIQSISKEEFSEVVIGSAPFLLTMIAAIAILYFFPGIATWFPKQMIKPF